MKTEIETEHGKVIAESYNDINFLQDDALAKLAEELDRFGWSTGCKRMKLYGLSDGSEYENKIVWNINQDIKVCKTDEK